MAQKIDRFAPKRQPIESISWVAQLLLFVISVRLEQLG
jgi:hypothetical protein